MDDRTIADLRADFELKDAACTAAQRAAFAAENALSDARTALTRALQQQYGPTGDKVVKTEAYGEVRLGGHSYLDRNGNLVARAHDRTKSGAWSKAPRILICLIKAPEKEQT